MHQLFLRSGLRIVFCIRFFKGRFNFLIAQHDNLLGTIWHVSNLRSDSDFYLHGVLIIHPRSLLSRMNRRKNYSSRKQQCNTIEEPSDP